MKTMKRESAYPAPTIRTTLIALASRYGDDWQAIYDTVKAKVWTPSRKEVYDLNEKEVSYLCEGDAIIAIGDEDYPDCFKRLRKPPFVVFVKDGRVSTVPFSKQPGLRPWGDPEAQA